MCLFYFMRTILKRLSIIEEAIEKQGLDNEEVKIRVAYYGDNDQLYQLSKKFGSGSDPRFIGREKQYTRKNVSFELVPYEK